MSLTKTSPKRRAKRARSLRPTAAELLDPADELPEGATPFERAQHYGARRHTVEWIKANEAAIDIAIHHGFDYTSQDGKAMISRIVLRVLDVAKTGRTDRM